MHALSCGAGSNPRRGRPNTTRPAVQPSAMPWRGGKGKSNAMRLVIPLSGIHYRASPPIVLRCLEEREGRGEEEGEYINEESGGPGGGRRGLEGRMKE